MTCNEYGKCNQCVNSQSYLWTALYSDGHGGLGLWQGQTDGNSRSQCLDGRGRSLYRHHLLLAQHCRSTARIGSQWHLKWVFTAIINISLQMCQVRMNNKSSAINQYLVWPWLTYSPSALGHSGAILCAASLRLPCRPSHSLLSFAFTLPIRHWWWQRRIDLYF